MIRLIKYYSSFYTGIKKNNWLIFLSIFLSAISSSTIVFIPLYLFNNLHLNSITVGLIISFIGLGSAIGGYIGGYFSDKYPPKLVSLISLFLSSIFLLLFCLCTNIASIFIILFLFGAANTAFLPASRLLIMCHAIDFTDMQHLSGIRYMLVNLGFGVGVYFGGIIMAINYIFAIYAILLLCSFLIISLSKKDTDKSKKTDKTLAKINRTILKQIAFICIVLMLVSLVFAQIRAPYALYLQSITKLSKQQFSNLFLLNSIVIILLQVPFSKILSKYSEKLILALGALLIGIGMLILIVTHTYIIAAISALMWTLGEILFFSTMQTYMYERMPEGYKGKSMGIYQLIYSTSNIIGPSLGMFIYQVNSGSLLWALCFISCALASTMIFSKKFDMKSL